jgi:mycofactocin system glycosyltransferase
MKRAEKVSQDRKSLAYRVREGVNIHWRDDGLVLILHSPLKAVVLNRSWAPVFGRLSTRNFISFEWITFSIGRADPVKMELFLNQLVRKGFLEQEGLSDLLHYLSVSIIVPVKNRSQEIASCLQSLAHLDYPSEKVEIIVVDDASDDHTPEVVGQFPVRLIALPQPKQASFCRNLAAQDASGEILAFIDSDCLADPCWLRELIPAFKDVEMGAIGGMVDAYYEAKGLDRYEKVKSSLKIGSWFRSTHEADSFFYVPSCNLLVRRDLFLKVGGFEEDLHVGEDVDLCWRLRDEGYHIEYRPAGKVYHRHRNQIKSFCSRRFDYGTSEPLLQHLHGNRIKKLIFPGAEALFWCAIALSILLNSLPFLAFAGIVVLSEVMRKFVRTRQRKLPVALFYLFPAVLRGHFAFFYHCCAFFSRYYLIGSLLFFPFLPWVSALAIGMHVLTGLVEFFIKKPRLSIPSFLFYFSLEQLSYQLGVWWGCFKRNYFGPVNPQIVTKMR